MRIGYWGDGPWAHTSLKKLIELPLCEIVFVVGRYSSTDCVLEEIAIENQIPFFRPQNVNRTDFLERILKLSPDLNVSMSYDQIIKRELLKMAPLGFINCHAGALPFYRGRNVLNWALINGEKRFGITVHYVDEGIDSGDIIEQVFVEIDSSDDYASVLKKATEKCPEILLHVIQDISEGKSNRITQKSIHPLGFYCGRRIEGDELINWEWTSWRIHNFVRGITFPAPCARTWLEGIEYGVAKTGFLEEAPEFIGTPGEIIGKTKYGLYVKTGDSFILVRKLFRSDSLINNKVIWINPSDFKIGMRFCSDKFLKSKSRNLTIMKE